MTADLELAKVYLQSGLLPPTYKTPEQVFFVIQKGAEIGLKPLHALSHIYVKDGTPSMRAELMLFLIQRHNPRAKIFFVERSEKKAVIDVDKYGDGHKERFIWTWEMAVQAKLDKKQCWVEYPSAMLTWRCVAEMARLCFPLALHGISHTPEELGLETDEGGTPMGLPTSPMPEQTTLQTKNNNEEDQEKQKIAKLVAVLTSPAVGFQVNELVGFLGMHKEEWGIKERQSLEAAVKQLKKSFAPEKNRQVVSLFLGGDLL